ncbi:MAG TPA: hypothetical protein VFU06_15050 [Longimicrobiales bacterium]|nr:hypothetical protein [Longimicrobiales bacterium]
MSRIFLLSPASCSGRRAQILLREEASFDLAVRLRQRGVSLADAFTFMSGLYFRGKAAYARAFADPPRGVDGALVITPARGLVPMETTVDVAELCTYADIPISLDEPRYREPLVASAEALARSIAGDTDVVLLGSIASDKYVGILLDHFGERLLFPADFVGRGDMSRGGLLLRCVDAGSELDYVPVRGATRRGSRPPKLAPRRPPHDHRRPSA